MAHDRLAANVLTALRDACAREAGGWATAHAVDVARGCQGGSAPVLHRLARDGQVARWTPVGGQGQRPLYRVRPPLRCPDDRTCHYDCHQFGAGDACWRVHNAAPPPNVFPGDRWPPDARPTIPPLDSLTGVLARASAAHHAPGGTLADAERVIRDYLAGVGLPAR